jgi:CRP-like cAMP-binding protein
VVRRDEEAGLDVILAELHDGDFFGEMALLDRVPRTATVRAITPVETYTLTAADFQQLLDRPGAQQVLQTTARRRAGEHRGRAAAG